MDGSLEKSTSRKGHYEKGEPVGFIASVSQAADEDVTRDIQCMKVLAIHIHPFIAKSNS